MKNVYAIKLGTDWVEIRSGFTPPKRETSTFVRKGVEKRRVYDNLPDQYGRMKIKTVEAPYEHKIIVHHFSGGEVVCCIPTRSFIVVSGLTVRAGESLTLPPDLGRKFLDSGWRKLNFGKE